MSPATSRFVEAGGLRTHYLEAGDLGGAPLILLHGGGAGANAWGNWRGTIPVLARHFHVLAVDMVGFGDTAKPDPTKFPYSQQARIDHLREIMRALRLDAATLVGNSMGGATALGLAVDQPSMVKRLVLMGSAGLNTEIHQALLPVINYDFTRDGMARLIRALVNDRFVIDDELVTYRHERSIDPEARRAYGATMQWIRDQGGLFYPPDFIARVRCPTLVVNGKDDKVVPLANAYRFLELIPRSWGYIMPDCGHWAMIEHPDDFARATLAFAQARD
jgi:2-hydroxy-6-oxo-6-(2'-aminophenyl)hexa-2,4-dienoate hydrolase